MMRRYQGFIQRLNNIQKVCILHNMTDGQFGPRARSRRDLGVAARGVAQALHRSMAWNLGPAGLPT